MALVRSSLVLALPLLLLPACKRDRQKLEKLVPDGATGLMSIDGQALVKSPLYSSSMALVEANAEAKAMLDQLESKCSLSYDDMGAVVVGLDLLSQGVMVAGHWPNIGKKESLECMFEVSGEHRGGMGSPTFSEEGGRTKIAAGEMVGWALDDDTLVMCTKSWSSAVEARIEGKGKAAIDNNLREVIGLTDTGKHLWFAGELPSVIGPFLEKTPVRGAKRAAGSVQLGDALAIELVAGFADEARAAELKDEATRQLEAFKGKVEQEEITKAMDSVSFEADGSILRVRAEIPVAPLMETMTQSMNKYVSRSKTSEARVQLAKLFDSASAYFNEEHVERGAVQVIGAGGSISELAPHRCPNDGKAGGSSGIVPPLSVDCSKGPGGRCVPGQGPQTEPGHYDASLWSDSDVWNGLNFQQDQPHYFHYQFRWNNDPKGFGACQFTAQAFGDLDGDGVFSTYERAGAADQNGVNGAAGLYIDKEVE